MKQFNTIDEMELSGKRVLVRVDFNVPLEGGKVTDDTRIKESLPTIEKITKDGGKVILMSHLGRPKGKVVEELRLKPVAKRLSELLDKKVKYLKDCIGGEVASACKEMEEDDIVLLENLRFHPEEKKNDDGFARALSSLGDLYVNDAFAVCHRAHASVVGIPKYLKSFAGYLLEKEIRYLSMATEAPERPFVLILGGAKVSDKIPVIENLIAGVDKILIGGAMAYTFLKAKGTDVGASKIEEEKIGIASDILKIAEEKSVGIELPSDFVIADKISEDANYKPSDEIPHGWMGLDIGEKTIERFIKVLNTAKTIVWNGPMGVFEMPAYEKGTRALCKTLAELDATTIIGGGESIQAVKKFGLSSKITHISTGGGASLEFLSGKILPGIAALSEGV